MSIVTDLNAVVASLPVSDEKRKALAVAIKRAIADARHGAQAAVFEHQAVNPSESGAAACAVAYARGYEAGALAVGNAATDVAQKSANDIRRAMLDVREAAVKTHSEFFDACDQNGAVAVGSARAGDAIKAARKAEK